MTRQGRMRILPCTASDVSHDRGGFNSLREVYSNQDYLSELLTDAGLATEADALFETTYEISKSTVDRFPGRGQHHNNHAWLLSRCAKKLDEALTHAEKAVEMEPGNGAFLDTLAEAHFQRGAAV